MPSPAMSIPWSDLHSRDVVNACYARQAAESIRLRLYFDGNSCRTSHLRRPQNGLQRVNMRAACVFTSSTTGLQAGRDYRGGRSPILFTPGSRAIIPPMLIPPPPQNSNSPARHFARLPFSCALPVPAVPSAPAPFRSGLSFCAHCQPRVEGCTDFRYLRIVQLIAEQCAVCCPAYFCHVALGNFNWAPSPVVPCPFAEMRVDDFRLTSA
jgi:hypothetical protein